ncbi:MAG: hypothetical protein NT099_09590 [Candidatus Saganbacteria bacterium]|nr:hypothetical protein [Candidatus Saganbacteria bacterium]
MNIKNLLVLVLIILMLAVPVMAKEKTISLDLKDVEISDAVTLIAKEMGKSVIVGKGVMGRLSVSLKNMTPEEALQYIAQLNGLEMKQKDNVIMINSNNPPQMYKLDDNIFMRSFPVNYVKPEELEKSVVKLLSSASKVVTTKDSKTLIVEGPLSDIREAEVFIANVDLPPKAVIVEAKIIEVKKNDSNTLGVNLNLQNQSGSQTLKTLGLADSQYASGAQGLFFSVVETNADAVLSALRTAGGYNLLSSHKVLAISGEKAEIITGARLGYKIKTVTQTAMVESIEFMDVGTKLSFTPSVKSDGNILMTIHPEISTGSVVNELPQKKSTETTTTLVVKDGQTIVIGGLVNNIAVKSETGVPFLSEIPFLGVAFKKTTITNEEREILVLITPHIYTPAVAVQKDEEIRKLEEKRQQHYGPIELFK